MSYSIVGVIIISVLLQAILTTAKRPDFIDDDMMDMVKDEKNACMAEFGTTEDMISKAGAGEIPNDKRITCYMGCLLSKLGMISDEGNIEKDMFLNMLPSDLQPKAAKALDACAVLNGADMCEKAYNGATCLYKNCPDMWFMI